MKIHSYNKNLFLGGLLAVCFLLMPSMRMQAQPGKVKKNWVKILEEADYLLSQGSYYAAADLYAEASDANPADLDLKYKEAEAYRLGRDYRKAAFAYRSIRRKVDRGRLEPTKYPLSGYYHGLMQKQSGDYEAAAAAFSEFIEQAAILGVEDVYKQKAQMHYDGIKAAEAEKEPAVPVFGEVDALRKKVNSDYTESSAFVMEDGRLLFTSLKAEEPIVLEGQQATSRLYLAEVEEDFRVRKSEAVKIALPGGLTHVGSACVSPDGGRLYLTLCEQVEGAVERCHIYKSERNGEGERYSWGRPELLPGPVNVDEHNSSTPFAAQTAGGKEVLYFSSNRPGGQGGYDLWAAEGQGGSFDKVLNLGETVNSPADEISPYLDDAEGYEDPREILYFSSDGHPSLGGFDICRSFRNGGSYTDWSQVQNAGKALNSTADDYGFVMSPDKARGFFISNRPGGYSIAGRTCCDDIFAAQLKDPELLNAVVADLMGRVFGPDKKNMVEAELQLWDITGGEESMLSKTETGEGGYFFDRLPLEREYALVVVEPGYEVQEFLFNTKDLKENKTFERDFHLKENKPEPTPAAPELCTLDGQVFAEDGAGRQTPLPNAKVTISRNGGDGEVLVELTTDERGRFQTDLPKDGMYHVSASKPGYLNASSDESTKRMQAGEKKEMSLSLREKKRDVAFRLENILYDFDSATLRYESIPPLRKLLALLNDNPDIVIELGSHTDSKGSDAYNLKLSQKRAQSVVDWLIERGIPQSRLVAKGYGESQPVAPNTNPDGSDNPDGRQLNRRTEFKIIGGVE